MEFEKTQKGKVRLYSCGGAGSNIGGLLEKHRNTDEIGFSLLDIVYIDTSKSNFKQHIDKSNAYLIESNSGESLDGSGKVRKENHEEINDRIKAILQQFKPADLNIVLSSASGGSGSVIGPLLTRELLSTGVPTVVLTVGSADTRLDVDNTLKTIKSYESIAKKADAPVVMAYIQNSQTTSRAEADSMMLNIILSLSVLFSRHNHELDSKDLSNWLRFNKVTTFPVQLASLTILENQKPIDNIGSIISVATLATEGTSTTLLDMPEYQCVGFIPENIGDVVSKKVPMHFIISDGIVPDITRHLQKILTKLEEAQAARVRKVSILSNTDKQEDSGLVL